VALRVPAQAGYIRRTTPRSVMPTMSRKSLSIDLYEQPGHLIRRAQQISVSLFVDTVGREVTPIQYAILRTLQDDPGIDQVTLAQRVALDNSTTAEAAKRLEARGLIVREMRARRQRSLSLTEQGEAVLAALVPAVRKLNRTLLANLDADERKEFMRLLRKFVHLNNEQSRAPLRSSTTDVDVA
jgi:DNA-binding MarR family transcriptional regulator